MRSENRFPTVLHDRLRHHFCRARLISLVLFSPFRMVHHNPCPFMGHQEGYFAPHATSGIRDDSHLSVEHAHGRPIPPFLAGY